MAALSVYGFGSGGVGDVTGLADPLPKHLMVLPAALALILGGAVGNLIDRAILGYVVDFVHVYYQNHHFPAFNLADSAITLGTILLLIDTFF